MNFQNITISQKEIRKQWHFRKLLMELFEPTLNDIIVTSHAMTLLFKKELKEVSSIQQQIQVTYEAIGSSKDTSDYRKWKIPVCFDSEYCTDLHHYFKHDERKVETYLEAFIKSTLWVHHYGFLPGFCYLSGLRKDLQLERKETPSLQIPKGAVAVGGSYAGIYPQESPGGWQLVGRTFVPLFDPNTKEPCFATPGDVFHFESISKAAYLRAMKNGSSFKILPKYTQHYD